MTNEKKLLQRIAIIFMIYDYCYCYIILKYYTIVTENKIIVNKIKNAQAAFYNCKHKLKVCDFTKKKRRKKIKKLKKKK